MHSKPAQQRILEIIKSSPRGISIKALSLWSEWGLGFGVEIEDIISVLLKDGKIIYDQTNDLVMPKDNVMGKSNKIGGSAYIPGKLKLPKEVPPAAVARAPSNIQHISKQYKTSTKGSVFAITCNQNTNALREAIFYSSLEQAKLKLSKMAADRKHNLGVSCWEQDDLSFSFILGWEEVLVKFSIIEIKLDTE